MFPKWIRSAMDDYFPGTRKLFPCALSSTFCFSLQILFSKCIIGQKYYNLIISNVAREFHCKLHQASDDTGRFDVHTDADLKLT